VAIDERILAAPASVPAAIPDGYEAAIVGALAERETLLSTALAQLAARPESLVSAATRIVAALQRGNKVLVAGNGGSAAEAQHFAAELVGRFKRERVAYAALALTTDTACLTAISNDYGYLEVFARQVEALGQPGDVLVAFSTSGESENLLRAAAAARVRGLEIVAVAGTRPSRLERLADMTLRMPLGDTAVVQELHKIATHILCDVVERELTEGAG
jgi:D-sedoheptulose 7-phosphate isomerase